jgi:Rrf2 family transcriptional regulator, cysteine metabolism repressor
MTSRYYRGVFFSALLSGGFQPERKSCDKAVVRPSAFLRYFFCLDILHWLVYYVNRQAGQGLGMKLTTKSEYTLLALIHLARTEQQGYVKIEEICEACSIPKKYLELLFSTLRQSRYVKTRRGSAGGYMLARPAKEIHVAEIIRLMDGALAPTESVSRYFFSDTPLAKEKKMIAVMSEIRDYIADRLERLTLADVI